MKDDSRDGFEESRRALTDGGQNMGEALEEEEGRISRARRRLSESYSNTTETLPESPAAWLAGGIASGYATIQLEDEAWNSLINELPEYTDETVDNLGAAASYAAEAGVNGGLAAQQLGEAAIGAAAAVATIGCTAKAVQKYRHRE